MTARWRPGPEHRSEAAQRLLSGLGRGADVFELATAIADLHPKDNTFPGEVFISIAVGALDAAGIDRDDPLLYEGMREQYLAECRLRGRDNKKIQFAVLAIGATRRHRARPARRGRLVADRRLLVVRPGGCRGRHPQLRGSPWGAGAYVRCPLDAQLRALRSWRGLLCRPALHAEWIFGAGVHSRRSALRRWRWARRARRHEPLQRQPVVGSGSRRWRPDARSDLLRLPRTAALLRRTCQARRHRSQSSTPVHRGPPPRPWRQRTETAATVCRPEAMRTDDQSPTATSRRMLGPPTHIAGSRGPAASAKE